jgi:peroxiredoxin
MSLKDELEKLSAQRASNEGIQIAYEALVNQLGRAETASRALRVGDPMPAFVLLNAEGQPVFSGELLGRGPLVVNFFRGNWCPYCRRTLEAFEAALPEISAAGGQVVALTPDTGDHPADTKRRHKLTYEILSDVDGAVGLQFGVLFRAPEPYRRLLTSTGVDLAERHGNEGWLIPMPATFIVDQSEVIRYAFVDVNFIKRAEPDEIVEVLQSLHGRPA